MAFINRQAELKDLRTFIDKEPAEILFIHGPKSLGKTTLLYKFLEQVQKKQKLDVKFMDLWARDTNEGDEEILRDMVTNNILYFDPTKAVYYPQGKSYHWGIRLYFESG